MKTWQKVLFIVVLVIFVSVSVTISLISISRPPYKFKEESSVGGNEGLDGWVLKSFNGNVNTKKIVIDHVSDKNGENPDKSKPVVAVGAYTVNADEYVEEIFIGASVRSLDETAFYNVKKLERVTVDPANVWYKDVDGVLFTKDGKTLLLYPACYGKTPGDKEDEYTYPDSYTVPEGVERIATFAFLKNEHIRDLTLPETLREIGDMAFFGCSRLGGYDYDEASDSLLGTGFTLPDGLEKIGSDAFSRCGSIAPCLFFPDSVKEIGHHALFGCSGIKSVMLASPDDSRLGLGESWLPKNVKAGPVWKAVKPQFGADRSQSEEAVEQYRADRLNTFREEAQQDG